MSAEKKSYTQILKATSIFGGVQVFSVIINIVRSKLIAILLGPTGMGMLGLYTSTIDVINVAVGCGLKTSAIRDISNKYHNAEKEDIGSIVFVIRRLVLITGIIGCLIAFFISPYLSRITFGNAEYASSFRLVSVIFLFNQLSVGQTVLMQGTQNYKHLTKSIILGQLFSLLFSIPLYFWLKFEGIVPAIIVSSIIALFFSWYFSKKIELPVIKLTNREVIHKGGKMMKMGLIIALTGLINVGTAYLLRLYIGNKGGVADVGLYTAGFAIVNSYVGLIFSAMATDYTPRLSAIAHNNRKLLKTINQQIIMMLLLLSPCIILFILFNKFLIVLLYSSAFSKIDVMIQWAMLGIFFRAISWALSFSFLARGDSKVFFWNELIANLYFLSLYIVGYYLGGHKGIGIAYLIGYLIYCIQMFALAKRRFTFRFKYNCKKTIIIHLVLCALGMGLTIFPDNNPYYSILGVLLFAIATIISIRSLNKLIDLRSIFARLGK